MTKMYKKADCEYKNGYIVCGDDVVAVDNNIVILLNKLDTELQRKVFDRENGKVEPVVAKEFVRVSERGDCVPKLEAKTPELDKAAEQGKKIMDEIDALDKLERINGYIDNITEVFEFIGSDVVVDTTAAHTIQFDLPVVGNPLELDKEELVDFVGFLFAE